MTALPAISRGATTINVDMDHGATYSGTAAAPDSGGKWNSISAAGTLGTVQDSQSNALSGVAIAFSSSGSVHIYYDGSTGSPNPMALMADYTYGATYTLTITGLAANQPYGLYAYSHGNMDNQVGTVTLAAANGGASASTAPTGDAANFRNIYLYGLGYNYVMLNGHADGSGAFTFTVVNYLNGFQLQQLSAPSISGLTNQTVVAGTTANLNCTVTGTPPPNLQWLSNSVPLIGRTNASLVLNNVQYAQNNTVYSLVASNYVGAATNGMTLSVIVTPAISGLNNQAVPVGATVTIPATVSGEPAPVTHWRFNGSSLSDGATGHGSVIAGSGTGTLMITNAQAADSGTYSLVASNSAGMATNSMTLTVSSGNVAPTITGPADQSVAQNSNAVFAVSVSGLPVPALQWRVNGTDIPGATNSSLTVTNVQFSQNGYVYSLVAGNSAGMATNSATLSVLVPPSISAEPADATVTAGGSAVFGVTADGVPAVSYQWNRNGAPIPGATGSSYTLAGAQGADNGAQFSVTVTNRVGVVTSSNAVLTVLSAITGTFLPTNGAMNISPDQQLRLIFAGGSPRLNTNGVLTLRDAANNSVVGTIDASKFLSYTPGNTSIQSIPNAAIRVVQGSYSGTGTGTTTYYYMPIALYGNQAWITFTNRLAYGHSYYVNCDTGLFLDSAGAAFPAVVGTNTWRFSTKASGPATPTANSGPTTITVGLDGAGDFATFQGAFDWIPQNNTLQRTIHVLPGIYRDSATLAGNRNFVTIVGDGASRTNAQLVYPFAYFAPPNPVFTAGSLRIESSDVSVENLTLDNIIYGTYHPTGYSSSGAPTNFAGAINTLASTGKRIVFDNVLVKGGQDTIYNISGIIYYHNCEVWGSVDFIYGAALEVFDQCNVVEIRSTGGPCTAPNTAYAQPYGITFLNCTFPQAFIANGYPDDVGSATTTFMRPWGKDGMTAAINCAVGSQFSAMAYQTFGNTNEDECRAREAGTTLIGGGTLNVPQIRWNAGAYWANTLDPDYTNNPSLTPTDPLLAPPTGTNNRVVVTVNTNDYTLSAIFGNSYFNLNGWLPAITPVITSQPAGQSVDSGGTVAFTVGAAGLPAPVFQWQKNGTNIPGATNATLTIAGAQANDAGTYAVSVSNSSGSLLSSNAVLAIIQPSVPQPAINTGNVLIITNYQANVTNGDNAAYVQNAINAASAAGRTNGLYGGTVEIPPGTFLCGPITLKNNVNLQIDGGAILRMLPLTNSPGQPAYPVTWYTNSTSGTVYFVVTANFISGNNLTNIEISGAGAIDGQGAAWWPWANTNGAVRPRMIALSGCNRELIQGVTLSNSPMFHIAISSGANTTVQYVTERANSSSDPVNPGHNTDACDITGTNTLVRFNDVSVGDDDFTCGGGSSDIVISNNVYGEGHGTSIGSYTSPSVSNYMVIDCTYSNTQTGAHIKTDRDRGGFVHHIRYLNLTMTNALHPIQIYCQYTNKTIPSLDSITPAAAAALSPAPVTTKTPHYRDIVISNMTAYAQSGRAAGLIWGLPESSVSNVTLVDVHLFGSKTFGIYDAKNVWIIDSTHTVPAGVSEYSFFDADVTFSNSVASPDLVTLDGATANGVANSFAFYNSTVTLKNTNAIALGSSVTLGSGTLIISNNLAMTPSNSFNFYLGTNAATIQVIGNLSLGGTNNLYAGGGFSNGTYTLFTYSGNLSGNLPDPGSAPANYLYAYDTNTVGQVKLIVSQSLQAPISLAATGSNLAINLRWPAAANAGGYWVLRSLTDGGPYGFQAAVGTTNYSDIITNPGTSYYYVVQATNPAAASGYSVQAAAAALPSPVPPALMAVPTGRFLQFSWPFDHTGWHLEVQTNTLGTGLGTNWLPVAGSDSTNEVIIPMDPANPSTFYRLIYP